MPPSPGSGSPRPSPDQADEGRTLPGALNEPEILASSSLAGGRRMLGFRAIQFLFLFLLSLIATRALGPNGRGQYALALNLATIVWVISHLSVEQSIGRMLARKEASLIELCHLASLFALTLGLLGMVIALVIGLSVRVSLLGGASPPTVALAAATIPFTLIGQMAAALLLRTGALIAYGWIIATGAAFQFILIVGMEVGVGLSPELAMAAALITIALVAIALAATLARRVGLQALRRSRMGAGSIGTPQRNSAAGCFGRSMAQPEPRPPPGRPPGERTSSWPLLTLSEPR